MSLEEHQRAAPKSIACAVITISDTRDAANDSGGGYLALALTAAGHTVARREIVQDRERDIVTAVRSAAADPAVELVLATGGTGIAPRDVTFASLRGIFDSEIPGFGELFRWLSYQEIQSATILSRAVGGLVHGKVVLAMPGSPKALRLAMEKIVLPQAGHLVAQTRRAP